MAYIMLVALCVHVETEPHAPRPSVVLCVRSYTSWILWILFVTWRGRWWWWCGGGGGGRG